MDKLNVGPADFSEIGGAEFCEGLQSLGFPLTQMNHVQSALYGTILNLAARVSQLELQLGRQSEEPQSFPKP